MHFGSTTGIPGFVNGLAAGGDDPDVVSEINFAPACKAQFAGADKQMQG